MPAGTEKSPSTAKMLRYRKSSAPNGHAQSLPLSYRRQVRQISTNKISPQAPRKLSQSLTLPSPLFFQSQKYPRPYLAFTSLSFAKYPRATRILPQPHTTLSSLSLKFAVDNSIFFPQHLVLVPLIPIPINSKNMRNRRVVSRNRYAMSIFPIGRLKRRRSA